MSISVYNSFHKIWKVQESKSGKSFIISNEGRRGEHISMRVNELISEKMDKSVLDNTGSLWTLYNGAARVRYDDVSFVPVAESSKSNGDAIIAYALSIKPGYKLTSVYNSAARIHAVAIDENAYIDFIANIPRKGKFNPHISITLLNEKEGKIIAISIGWDGNGKLKVTERLMNVSENPAKGEKGYVNTFDFAARARENGKDVLSVFYPTSPTHLIVTNAGGEEKTVEVIKANKSWREPKRYNILVASTVEELTKISETYRAVTLSYDRELSYLVCDVMNDEIGDAAKRLFDTVYYLGSNGFIYKAKIAGKLKEAPVKK